ncbi:Nucleotidyl transferase [Rhizoctonia solani]|uniref:Nucleotidyl transferase n=1 Tax=Rhizoctonia solani TaxID=456999 RepID=A0A8H7IJ27_9AGAM|nr:Nucleotidyl transferase [Rhizoctonia solani]
MASKTPNAPLGIEEMFQQIMIGMQKSVRLHSRPCEVPLMLKCGKEPRSSELRNECAELRQANAALEKQVHRWSRTALSPGILLPLSYCSRQPDRTPDPLPFLAPTGAPSLYVPSTPSQETKSLECPGFWAVVPAGGAGTRLWPLSRESYPKFFLDVTLSGRSLIQSTWDRLLPLTTPERLMVVTGQIHAPTVQVQLPDLDSSNLLAEPSPKESAAAIGLAAAVLARRDPDAVLGSFAADHMISGADAFMAAVTEAVATARHDYLVTIGIAPSHPSTGFGYVRLGRQLNLPGIPNSRIVSQFKEKPDARTAAAYITSGNYRWNAGMFVVKAKVLMALYAEYCPELAEGLEKIAEVWEDQALREKALAEIWPTLPKIAIDNAVAEPAALTGELQLCPLLSVGMMLVTLLLSPTCSPQSTVRPGFWVTETWVAGGIVVPASGRLIACLGVDDLVVVDTNDALLITTRARSQEVKKIVQKTKESGWKQLL